MLFFSPIMLLGNSQCANYAEESAHYAGFLSQQNTLFAITAAKKSLLIETVQVLFYTLLGFDFNVDCPTAPAHPARRVSDDLTLSAKSENLGDFTLMKRLGS